MCLLLHQEGADVVHLNPCCAKVDQCEENHDNWWWCDQHVVMDCMAFTPWWLEAGSHDERRFQNRCSP